MRKTVNYHCIEKCDCKWGFCSGWRADADMQLNGGEIGTEEEMDKWVTRDGEWTGEKNRWTQSGKGGAGVNEERWVE